MFERSTSQLAESVRRPQPLATPHASSRNALGVARDVVRGAAAHLAEEVQSLVAETGYERIHVVAHRLGGLIARYYVTCLGADGSPLTAGVNELKPPSRPS